MPETTTNPGDGKTADMAAAMAEEEAAKAAAAGDAAQEAAEDGATTDEDATDWGAAMAEQAEAEAASDASDDWGAAMAEQSESEAAISAMTASAKPATSTFKDFGGGPAEGERVNDIDFILDIPVQLTVELGRTKLPIKNLLQLAQGSVVELDGLAGEPMDVLVNGCLIAQGEVVVVNDKFGIRLTDVITPAERIRKLNR